MAGAFKSTPKGFTADLEAGERRLLRTLFQDVILLLDAPEPPAGPAAGSDAGPDTASDRDSDPFWAIVAGLGPVAVPGTGEEPDAGPVASPDGSTGGIGGTGGTDGTGRAAPQDPALARLLPSGVRGETDGEREQAAQFRALTEDGVRRAKTEDLQRAVAALQSSPLVLGEAEAISFGRALNDVRLVLSARLGIETEEDAERVHAVLDPSEATDVESYMALLYNFTTWLQETLMQALTTRLPD